ncbi:hypothetical protein K1719_044197 [Acacia pycnantha]|nr:hypothetical protein K1719_044197 [Acacia pycnantha]
MAKLLFLAWLLLSANFAVSSVAMSSYEPNPPAEAPIIRKQTQHSNFPWHKKTSIELTYEQVLGSDVRLHLSKQHHRSFDGSIAAGVVILGGLATTFLVAVFFYIRASGRSKPQQLA